ncbi:MAG: hypothetical protein M3546_03710 [Actinomycetota bacterium]|nr:hypothetical protein [Actinomycetota bacterium]
MADRELTPTAARRNRVLAVVVAVLVLGGVLGGLALLLDRDSTSIPRIAPATGERVELTLGATIQPFAADRACGVYVVPVDGTSEGLAARLARALPRRAPVEACVTPSFRLDLAAFDRRREQVDAVIVADQLARAFQDARGIAPTTILGVTALDIYSSAFPDDEFGFGVAKKFPQKQGFAVVSTARMKSGADRFRRLETMAMRYVGLLYFDLPESSSPTSSLAPAPVNLEELDLLRPEFSDPPPSATELRAARQAFLSKK